MAKTKLKHPRGSTIIIAIGIVAILMTISLAISVVALFALRSTRQISMANQAYFAAESGVEEAIYQMAGHDFGFESSSVDSVLGDPIIDTDPQSPTSLWEINNRTKEISLDNDPALPGGNSTSDMLTLARGSALTVGLFFDNSNPYDSEITRTYLNKVVVDIMANPDDGIVLTNLLPNDFRVSEAIFVDENDNKTYYLEDSRVISGDLDESIALERISLSYVDLNLDNVWSRGEPVYFNSDAVGTIVEPGDIRVNTISPDYTTCTELYNPSQDQNDIEVIDGQCDTETALLNIDNDQDGLTDEDEINLEDDDGDGFVDEDPDSWPLTEAFFFVSDESDCALNIEPCLENRTIGDPDNVVVYADTPAVIYNIVGTDPLTGDEAILEKIQITKTNFIDNPHQASIEMPLTAASLTDIRPPFTEEIKLNLFSVIKGIKYKLSDPDSGVTQLSKLKAEIRSIGKSGPFRQTLESTIQQAETVPIFNYTITY